MHESFHLCLCLFQLLFLFSHLQSIFPLLAVTSFAPRLTHLVYITWPSRCWSVNPIFSLLLSSSHLSIPPSSDLLNPGGRELSLSNENRAVHCWGAWTSYAPIHMGTHIIHHPGHYAGSLLAPRCDVLHHLGCPASVCVCVCVCYLVCNASVTYVQDPAVYAVLIEISFKKDHYTYLLSGLCVLMWVYVLHCSNSCVRFYTVDGVNIQSQT